MSGPRPAITLKLATSMDGRIATASGESRWITGATARSTVHTLRAGYDAILVGVGTVIADDPELTVRMPDPIEKQPLRVVLDSRQRIRSDARLVTGARTHSTLVLTVEEPQSRLLDAGVRVRRVAAGRDGRVDLRAAMGVLGEEGVGTMMVEGGGEVAASFIREDLVDDIEWFRAPILLGAAGKPALGELPMRSLAEAPRYAIWRTESVGDDLWERYARLEPSLARETA